MEPPAGPNPAPTPNPPAGPASSVPGPSQRPDSRPDAPAGQRANGAHPRNPERNPDRNPDRRPPQGQRPPNPQQGPQQGQQQGRGGPNQPQRRPADPGAPRSGEPRRDQRQDQPRPPRDQRQDQPRPPRDGGNREPGNREPGNREPRRDPGPRERQTVPASGPGAEPRREGQYATKPAVLKEQLVSAVPSPEGRFGRFGGAYVPETLVAALKQLDAVYAEARNDERFWDQLHELLRTFVGRPTPLDRADRLTQKARSLSPNGQAATIWLKREDLAHTGAHKINNTMGQALLTRRMGKQRVIAETGAGQHGVATATACARFGLSCEVYMGAEDVRRQRLNVTRMRMMGAKVVEVHSGSRTLKDATNEAMRDWMASVEGTHYIIGSVVGPHPFPMIVRDFQSIIGRETKAQCLRALQKLPDCVVACVGGGSNAAGMFYPFVDDDEVKLVGVEAGGHEPRPGRHASTLSFGQPGILHGSLSYVLQDQFGQTAEVHSCSAGLDYPGVGPEHAYWKESGRVSYSSVTDAEALDAFTLLARTEGIIPALETAHAIAEAVRRAATMDASQHLVICLSGRGDKDVDEASRLLAEREAGRGAEHSPS